jgi:hypothetical protein
VQSERLLEMSSTEFIQEQETTDEDHQWNPEVDVSGYHAKQIPASTSSGWGSHWHRRMIC